MFDIVRQAGRRSAAFHFCRMPLAILAALAGCTGSKPAPLPATGAAAARNAAADQCEQVVASLHDTFRLQRLGLTTAVRDGVARMNDWQLSCAATGSADGALPGGVASLLSDPQRQDLSSQRFTLRDGEHVRDCVLLRAVTRYAGGADDPSRSELDRVVATFQYVIRTIGLADRHPEGLPLTRYEICLLGKGTAEDRAWVFAGLLKQRRIDALVIRPAAAGEAGDKDPAEYWLVGVPLDGQVYLFDTRLGIPIPAGAVDGATASVPATFDQALADPQVFRRLDWRKYSYPLRSDDLKNVGVRLIGDLSEWTARMQALQTVFTGQEALVVADRLDDSEGGAGFWTRGVRAGKGRWSQPDQALWEYPEAQAGQHATMSESRQQALDRSLLPFEAYLALSTNRRGELVVKRNEQLRDRALGDFDPMQRVDNRITVGSQKKARLQQMEGDFVAAIPNYTDVRERSRIIADKAPFVAEQDAVKQQLIRDMHLRAIDDAAMWTASCKFEQGEFEVAGDRLEAYRRQHKQGFWLRECRYLLAMTHAARKDYSGAIEELIDVETDDPEYGGYHWLIRTWQAARSAQKATAN
ncbi:MAG: tetratricopeptide repeat protein [Planctomycetaceae bacterium]